MSAARNADAAGDQAAARQLVQAAIKARGEQAPQDQIDTFGEKAEDVGRAAAAGAGRGVIGTLELPEMAGRGLLRLGQEGLQAMGYDVGEDIPVLDTATGRALRSGVGALGLFNIFLVCIRCLYTSNIIFSLYSVYCYIQHLL